MRHYLDEQTGELLARLPARVLNLALFFGSIVAWTRKVDDLVKALGVDGMSKSEVSRICGELDTAVAAFRTRR